ncbi:hypothetical protein GO594_22350 [Pseudomonas otitidis]|uniref:Helix-turn-helix domain-containing protein n=1 Tax=Metapseudomonas otitidis TaxID=319939 RepID=A0A7X3HB59_9GAMM|nr:hypothetical protein [Pseudomonas otitidis]MWK58733.1 hypothetical protein [Pseudomonas otitidis]
MARIRTIKPEFWTSEQVMECSPIARLLFVGIWNFCDDGGNHPDSEKSLKALIFPGDDIGSSSVRQLLDELSSAGLITFYEQDGKRFLHVNGWHHQKIERPTFKYPRFVECTDETGAPAKVVDDQSTKDGRAIDPGKEGEGKGKGKEKSKRATPPKGDAKSRVVTAEEMVDSLPRLSIEVARDYLAHRRDVKARLTERAWKGIAKTLSALADVGFSPDAALSKAIERGWKGLEVDWLIKPGPGPSGSTLTNLPSHKPSQENPDGRF